MPEKKEQPNKLERPPIVVIMGHIDHGKSTLLDYIRKTNVVEKEAGGITQHISAYEVVHKNEAGKDKKITFLDTPGHEAFSKMRERGAKIADIAILVVSAEDGVKTQTVEAWKTIEANQMPMIVAINKIDKAGANIEKTKMDLAENGIYLEGYGGNTPFVPISAKTGEGVEDLLSLINIMAEMEGLTADKNTEASGFVIESDMDKKRGIQATLVIKNGTLKKGQTVAVLESTCSTRIIENFLGKMIDEASFSSPVRLVGFSSMPKVGAEFRAFKTKDEALTYAEESKTKTKNENPSDATSGKKIIPLTVKADVAGSLEAIEKEVKKIEVEGAEFKIVQKGIGAISESDIKNIAEPENSIIVGFNTKCENTARELAERNGATVALFDIIYKMTEWLAEEIEKRRPRIDSVETLGKVKILKVFNKTKDRQVAGGKVIEGRVNNQAVVKILRRDFEIGKGKIVNLEKAKTKVGSVEEGAEFGMLLETKLDIVPGDVLESFNIVQK